MMPFDDPMQFWSIFAFAMAENRPPQNEIDCVLPQFEYLGIEIGKPWSAAGVGPIYFAEMNKAELVWEESNENSGCRHKA